MANPGEETVGDGEIEVIGKPGGFDEDLLIGVVVGDLEF